MFQRYTDETKRAIYFSAQRALYDGAPRIDSTHLVLGLLMDDDSRANRIFRLRERLPEEAAKQSMLKSQNDGNKCELALQVTSPQSSLRKQKVAPNEVEMSSEGKRILACAAREANRFRDYWIDTEHLVLGILREDKNTAATRLRGTGLNIQTAGQLVIENQGSRPPRPDPVLWWVRRRPLGVALTVIFLIGVITALYLLGLVGAR
jgi:ATP-dependent Clp protease ATP-binding subunit ClpC